MWITWVSGWGICPQHLQPLARSLSPGATIALVPPFPSEVERAAQSDLVVGWSLGAWRLLDAAAHGVVFHGRVVLLSPFVAFCSKFGMGGRCNRAQLAWLRRWVQREPLAALADFHQRAGLPDPPTEMPYSVEELIQGLDVLMEDASPELRAYAAQGLPRGWVGVIGARDNLLRAEQVAQTLPGTIIAPDAGHAAHELAAAARKEFHAL